MLPSGADDPFADDEADSPFAAAAAAASPFGPRPPEPVRHTSPSLEAFAAQEPPKGVLLGGHGPWTQDPHSNHAGHRPFCGPLPQIRTARPVAFPARDGGDPQLLHHRECTQSADRTVALWGQAAAPVGPGSGAGFPPHGQQTQGQAAGSWVDFDDDPVDPRKTGPGVAGGAEGPGWPLGVVRGPPMGI